MSGLKSSDDAPNAAKSADDAYRGLDVQRLENAMREKISEFTSPIASQGAKEMGLAFARVVVDQILVQVRAQAELKNTLACKATSEVLPPPQSPLLH
jgi:hypothetical protein